MGLLFTDANMKMGQFADAILKGANLKGADLSEAEDLTCSQVQSATIDRNTKLPSNLCIEWNPDDTFQCLG